MDLNEKNKSLNSEAPNYIEVREPLGFNTEAGANKANRVIESTSLTWLKSRVNHVERMSSIVLLKPSDTDEMRNRTLHLDRATHSEHVASLASISFPNLYPIDAQSRCIHESTLKHCRILLL
jgi:hypothetical protein